MTPIPLGPFLLERPIGRGGMSVVWRGRHRAQGVPVALKVLDTDPSDGPRVPEAFRAEVEAVAGLDHPGIILIFDHGTVPDAASRASAGALPAAAPYLAMELVEGGSLERLARDPCWEVLEGVCLELLDALAHAHARGVIHRDLKPTNVLLATEDAPRPGIKLSDFGIATVGRHRGPQRIRGTPRYMAPEQFRGDARDVGPWTDLYALGCVMWELTTGAPPFRARGAARLAHQHLYDALPAFEPLIPVPEGLGGWLARLLHKRPLRRFTRAADAAWGLRTLGARRTRAPASPRPSSPPPALTVDTLDDLLADTEDDPDRTLPDLAPLPQAALEPVPGGPNPQPIAAPPLPTSWARDRDTTPPPRLLGAGVNLFGLRAIQLVGRHQERTRLWRHLARVAEEGRARAVLLHGPAGVGKSALARWLEERVQEVGAAIPLLATHGRYDSDEHGLVAMVARDLSIDGLTREAALTRLEGVLRDVADTTRDEQQALLELVFPPDDEADRKLPDHRARRALLLRYLTRHARRRPVVVWLDDIPWGPASLEFVRWTLTHHADHPVLYVLTARDETLAEVPRVRDDLQSLVDEGLLDRVRVPPLSVEDADQLVQRLLGVHPDLARQVALRTNGNPLFAVQLLGDWVQRDVLVPTPRGLRLDPAADVSLPDDLHAVWDAHLARLFPSDAPDARRALEVAAALGDVVADDEWREASAHAGVTVPDTLVPTLVRARLALVERRRWRFAHGMLRESIERASREAGRWPWVNMACAAMLETRRGHPGRVARRGRHLLEAGHSEEALRALLESARRRLQKDEVRAAVDLLQTASRAVQVGGLGADDPRRGVHDLLAARVDKSRHQLDAAEALAAGVVDRSLQHGWPRLEAEAMAELGDIARIRGDLPEAQDRLRGALLRYASLHDAQGLADTQRALSSVLVQVGQIGHAERLLHEARDRYETLEDRFGAAMCLAGLGDIARTRQQWDRAQDRYNQSLARMRALGHRSGVALGLHGLAEVRRLTGSIDEAEAGYRDVIRLDDALGRDSSVSRLNLALCLIQRGDATDASEILLDLLERWTRSDRPGYRAIVRVALLPCTAALGRWRDFRAHVEAAAPLLRDRGLVDLDVARMATLGGDLAQHHERHAEARAAWRIALEQWEALEALGQAGAVQTRLAQPQD